MEFLIGRPLSPDELDRLRRQLEDFRQYRSRKRRNTQDHRLQLTASTGQTSAGGMMERTATSGNGHFGGPLSDMAIFVSLPPSPKTERSQSYFLLGAIP